MLLHRLLGCAAVLHFVEVARPGKYRFLGLIANYYLQELIDKPP